MIPMVPPAAIIVEADTPIRHLQPKEVAQQMEDLRLRAEAHVRSLRSKRDVERYELERVRVRAEYNLPPVPITNRGKIVLAAQYAVDEDGCLILG